MTDSIPGRRRYDVDVHEMEPGDYTVGTSAVLGKLPSGEVIRVPFADNVGPNWMIEEHEEDDTVTLNPSINMHPVEGVTPGWHGWLRNGQWVTA